MLPWIKPIYAYSMRHSLRSCSVLVPFRERRIVTAKFCKFALPRYTHHESFLP